MKLFHKYVIDYDATYCLFLRLLHYMQNSNIRNNKIEIRLILSLFFKFYILENSYISQT